jgi:hypothetical protein
MKSKIGHKTIFLDCFVAALLAMTNKKKRNNHVIAGAAAQQHVIASEAKQPKRSGVQRS